MVHFYNSTSVAQREQVFKKSKEEIRKIATDGAALVKQLAAEYEGNFRFEYSPESFTGTEPEYALEVCNAVLDILVNEDMPARVKALSLYFENAVHGLKGAKHVLDIRNYGLAAGFTIAPAPGEPALRPYQVAMKCWDKGFYVRYGGDTIQLAPPFISTEAEIDRLVSALGDALQETA